MSGFKPSHVYVAADHGGFEVKQELVKALEGDFTIEDMGAHSLDSTDDFVGYAEAVARAVAAKPGSMGLLICRSGEGMVIAANKIDGIRAALAWEEKVAIESRDDNDANILTLPNDYVSTEEIINIAKIWLTTPFSKKDRYSRRIEQIAELES